MNAADPAHPVKQTEIPSGHQSDHRTEKRRPWLVWGVLAYLAILVAVVASLFLLGRVARLRLDQALGERLAGVATTTAFLVDGDSVAVWTVDPEESLEFIWLDSRLEQIRAQNDLAEVSLSDPEEKLLMSASGRLSKGERNVFWDLDRAAVQLALEGFPAVSKLYRVGDIYQKSAHVPIFSVDGRVTGVLTVEGNADFFDSLAALRRWAWLTGLVVMVFLTVMGWFLFRLQAAMERYRASVWRQENLAAMGRMTAGIAHEIRNPLGIIRGAAQHLDQRLAAAGIEDEVARFIPEEVDRLDRVLKGYLAFGSDSEVELEPVHWQEPLRRTLRILEDELAVAGIEVTVQQQSTSHVLADPRRLQQVLLNLLLNARDAMPNGGRVAIQVRQTATEVILTVTDEGSGLQGVSQERLFAPFWTDKEKGSGLGLAMARRLVERQNGSLQLRDRTDRAGAVAEIRLPRFEGTAQDTDRSAADQT
jgi:signal transduction histidine kinase